MKSVGATKRGMQRLGECPDVDAFPLTGQPRLDPVAELVFRRGEFRCGAEGRPVFFEVIAQQPKGCGEAGQRGVLRGLKQEHEDKGQGLHVRKV